MRIVLNIRDLDSGGAERVAILMAAGFLHFGHTVIIATCAMPKKHIMPVPDAVKIIAMGISKPIKQAYRLADIVNREHPDAVIAFGVNMLIGAAISRAFWKINPLLIFRNENNLSPEWQQASPLNRIFGPLLSRWAARRTRIVAVSQSLARATSDYLRIDPTQVVTILNPVIDDTVTQSMPPNMSLHPWLKDQSTPTFVAMGRLEYQKGFDVLIDAFSKIRPKANARLLIFGKGSQRDALQKQIEIGNLQDICMLAGHTDNPIAQMGAAHAFVLSSRFEGFGLVLVEALWSGVQVIATNCDYGPAEVLQDGLYGTLVPTGDSDALAAAMFASLHHPRTSQRPPDAWFGQFTATEAARQHLALLERL